MTSNSITYNRKSAMAVGVARHFGCEDFVPLGHQQKGMPVIEHDVWIGQDATLARGVTLGTGCVVAAGSVVTKSVEPYTVVGGNPARPIRRRFPDELAERLLASRWWRFAFPHLRHLPYHDPDRFLDGLQADVGSGRIEEYAPEPVDAFRVVSRVLGRLSAA